MHSSKLLSLDEAIEKIKLNFIKISSEDIFLQSAVGRCLSEPIISKRDNPSFDVSSMDGYAINYNDYNVLSLKSKNNDFVSLKKVLESCGYSSVIKYDWRETEHATFDDHSQAYIPHMDKENGTLVSLNVECIKRNKKRSNKQ